MVSFITQVYKVHCQVHKDFKVIDSGFEDMIIGGNSDQEWHLVGAYRVDIREKQFVTTLTSSYNMYVFTQPLCMSRMWH